ncbi:MAG: hypothetical protein ABRQ25_17465 [Clostridiaceae bacterium]
MTKTYKSLLAICVIVLFIEVSILLLFLLLKKPAARSASTQIYHSAVSYPHEERGAPAYDKITGNDGWPHYRVFFWVPETATVFTPYADTGVNTNVSSHGPVENWSVVETKTTANNKKLVFIFVPKTFVYLYGYGFEKVIHLNYK